jgi:hypothetical protein
MSYVHVRYVAEPILFATLATRRLQTRLMATGLAQPAQAIQSWQDGGMAKISLRIVDDTNRDAVAALCVSPAQERYVDSAANSLAEAASHTPHPWLRAIYAGDQPVGLLAGRLRRR